MTLRWEPSMAYNDLDTWWLITASDRRYVGFVDRPVADGGELWRAVVAGGAVKTFDNIDEAKAWAFAVATMEEP